MGFAFSHNYVEDGFVDVISEGITFIWKLEKNVYVQDQRSANYVLKHDLQGQKTA